MDDVARVILAIGSQEVAEEVLHLLDRRYLFRAPGETEINLRSGRARRTAVAPKAD